MITGFLTIGLLETLAVIFPGPDFAMTVKNTLNYNRRMGIATAFGITSGILFHMTYCVLGFALIISQSAWLFNSIKYAGSAYLIYSGFQALFSKKNSVEVQTDSSTISSLNLWIAFRQGLLCNILNPKASLFFLGLFTLVIRPDTPFHIQLLYALEIIGITLIWFCTLPYLLTHKAVHARILKMQKVISTFMGILLIGFGAQLALFHR